MAKQSVVDVAIAEIDGKIADLQRAKDIILAASGGTDQEPDAKPKRARRKRAGLPEQTNGE